MSSDQNTADAAEGGRDNLQAIEGVGPGYAKALHDIGINRFADFAQYSTAEELHQTLKRAKKNIPLSRIENETGEEGTWLQQAKDLAEQAVNEGAALEPEPENTEPVQESGEAPNQPDWTHHAEFTVFFDYMEEDDERIWQTRAYHNESGDEDIFAGLDPSPWITWILNRAELPVPAVSEVAEEATAVESKIQPPAEEIRIEILDVQLSKTGPSSGVPEKRLMAQVRFQLSGPEAESITADRLSYRVEIHMVDLESDAAKLVASAKGQLQPQVLTYTSNQHFPIPEVGRYEVHCLVLLLPPGTRAVYRQGPTVRIVP